jgi:MYXO-CTERM domain-containing protein
VSGFVVGVSQNGGASFTPKLHLTTIQGPASCPPNTTTGAICTTTNDDAAIPYNPFWSLCTSTIGACYQPDSGQPLTEACIEAGACASLSGGSSGGSTGGETGSDAGSNGGAKPGGGGCGCSVVGGGGAAGALFGLIVAAIAARRRRTR